MKDMHLNDILFRQDKPLNSLSLYKNGLWGFILPVNPIATFEGRSYYLMSDPFGLVKQGVLDPKKTARRGSPGDYVALDQFGSYTLITPAEYKSIFPTPDLNPPKIPNNSEQIKDPTFLTNILKGSGASASNSKTSKPTPTNTGY